MSRFVTGWFNSKPRKLSFLTVLYCADCGHLFESSRTGRSCPRCASNATLPAANWAPVKYGMPKLETGKVPEHALEPKTTGGK
jgi:predicted amidophosphoribosyltransferase